MLDTLDDLPLSQRLVTAQLAAERLGRARRTVARWVAAGRLHPVACLVEDHAQLYRETDVLRAERTSREAEARGQFHAQI